MNPFMKPKLPAVVPAADSGLPSPSPEPAVATPAAKAEQNEEGPAAKKARTESGAATATVAATAAHDPNAPPSSACAVHEHGARGDEFDEKEAAGAKEHMRTSDKADAAAAAVAAVTPATSAAATASSSDSKMDESTSAGTAPAAASSSAASAAASSLVVDPREKRKRGRGQNKNSEREFFNTKGTIEAQICKTLAGGRACVWGDKCRFSHDMEAYRAATARAAYPGLCPLFKRFGDCPAGLTCKWSTAEGHAESSRPAVPEVRLPELNALPRELGSELKSCPLEGPKYEKSFPRTSALTKRYEVWRKKAEQIRNRKQAEKEALQRIQNAEIKAAKLAGLAAASTAAAAAAPVVVAAPTAAPAAASPADSPAAAAAPAAAAVSSSSAPAAAAAAAASAAAITPSLLPPSFMPHSLELELEIAALKASYTPAFPHTVDPFAIVSETHSDWSSGCILIDLERKNFDFRDKLYLAPLTTVGNLPFRRVCKDYGADVTIGEMAMCNSLGKGAASEWSLLRRHPSEKHFGIQLAASHPDQVSRACELIANTCEVDFVDLNIGCPIDGVTDKGMGSAMMQRKRMKNVEPIIRSMRTILDCPATIKMRMGWSGAEVGHCIIQRCMWRGM